MEQKVNVESRIELLEGELAALRKSYRTLRIVFGALVVACLAFGTIPQVAAKKAPPPPKALKLVRAEQFVLVDSKGNALATLGNFPAADGTGYGLTFYDASGNQTITLGNANGGEFLGFYDGNDIMSGSGAERVGAGIDGPNGPAKVQGMGFVLFDPGLAVRGSFGLTLDDKQGFIDLIDPNGTNTGVSDNGPGNFAGFYTNDSTGKNRAIGGIFLDGTQVFVNVTDTNGTNTGVSADENHNFAGFYLNDPTGNRNFDAIALDGSWHASGLADSSGKQEARASESGGAGGFEAYTNGTETGHLP